jgi:RNA polymerase-binding transcription factor DksA
MERYSDKELEEFKQIIKDNYRQAKQELQMLRDQVAEFSENITEGFGADYTEDSSSVSQLELLNEQVLRKRDQVQDLQNAMLRIKNKVYGVCSVTGKLIDRKRLEAVPTTTKSLEGMKLQASGAMDVTAQDLARRASERKEGPNKIISKIKKPPPPKAKPKPKKRRRRRKREEEEEDDLI